MRLLEPLDAAMMTAETLSNPLHVAAVLIMSPPADAGPNYVDRLYRETLTAGEQVDPRLRRFPYRGVSTTGLWVWREADTLEMEQHCRRITLPAGSGESGFWQTVGELHSAPLTSARPMWMFYVIDGLEKGRFALYIKVHHTLVDGVAGMRMIADRLSDDPRRRSMPPFYADGGGRNDHYSHPGNGLPHNLFGQPNGLLSAAVSTLVRAAVNPLLPLGAPYTRFNGRLGHERAVVAGSWAKDRIRTVQQTAGVSGNDVVTAVVGGVLRAWLSDHSELPRQTLVGICPITARDRQQQPEDRGNLFGMWLCPLGTNLDDPAARLALIHRSMAEGKRRVAEHGRGPSLLSVAPAIALTVLSPMVPFAPRLRTGYNVPISSVPGPRNQMYWNGARVDDIYPVSAVSDGQGLNATICSYANRVSFGYVTDRSVMPDIDALLPLTERCLAELESAVGVGA